MTLKEKMREQDQGPYDPSKIIIEPHQLKKLMDDKHENLHILQALFDQPFYNDTDVIQDSMEEGYIPGARHYRLKIYGEMDKGWFIAMPTQKQFRELARRLDFRVNDTYVCYDSRIVHGGSRLAWTLLAMGAKNVHVLNGNNDRWVDLDYKLNKVYDPNYRIPRTRPAKDSDFEFTINRDLVYDYDKMKEISKSNLENKTNIHIIDTRMPSPFENYGHIPTSKNMPYWKFL